MNDKKAAIILAAGMGTRMKSDIPKVMHALAGMPLINHVIDTCENTGIENITVIVGPDMKTLETAVSPHKIAVQHDRLGTGDAAKTARETLKDFDGYIFILNGDGPFIKPETLNQLYDQATKTGLSVLGFETNAPHGYGRFIINDQGHVTDIIEEKDCDDAQREIQFCNSGAYCVTAKKLFDWLDQLSNDNSQNEYYLTDLVRIATNDGVKCSYSLSDQSETLGINSRSQLADATKIIQNQLRGKAMDGGVTMIDPSSVTLSMDTQFGTDVIIEPNVFIGNGVRVGSHTHIHAFSHIEGTIIGEHSSIGPFARIRPQSIIGNNVSVGNFIEVNRSTLKDGVKSKHVSYLGDAIIDEKTNIGAGTVIANYDGFNKHISNIGKGTFIGSNSTIISPVNIGDGAIIGAGSVITTDVDDNSLSVARSKQTTYDNWAISYRTKNKKD